MNENSSGNTQQPVQQKRPGIADITRALRPSQWTNNIIVLAAFFFALWDRSRAQPFEFIDFIKEL